jgi:hypothetical protein
MNNRILTLIGGIAAGGALVYLLTKPAAAPEAAANSAPTAVASSSAVTPADQKAKPAEGPAAKPKAAPTSAWAKLSAKFGEDKTKLSKKISSDLGDVIDEGMELANAMAKNTGAASPAEAASKEALKNLVPQLGLDETQQQKAGDLIQGAVKDRMDAVTQLASAMRAEPEQMMEMFLAGDALSRGEITQGEYDQMTQPTRTMLENIGGFVMGRPGAGPGSQLLGDEAFTKELNGILTPDQQVKLTEISSQWTEQAQTRGGARGGIPFQSGQIPVMDLEKLDQTVTSVKKMAGAARIMIDAMQGLKQANPDATKTTP